MLHALRNFPKVQFRFLRISPSIVGVLHSAGKIRGGAMASPKRRILVVDDYVSAANATAQLLRLAGHDVTVAYEAADVIPRTAEFQPEVILLDISLPGDEDGVMLARR